MSSQFSTAQDPQAVAELMELLLDTSDEAAVYPWNPAAPESEEYYARMDGQFSMDDWSEAEISARSEPFFASIQSCWADSPAPEVEAAPTNAIATLSQKFADRIPQNWLNSIADKVAQVANANLEPADRLVDSVKDLLSNWSVDDLALFARPYAYAMRCETEVENIDAVARNLPWEELSDMEKAKLTIDCTDRTV
jgi:hypothetical protein